MIYGFVLESYGLGMGRDGEMGRVVRYFEVGVKVILVDLR